MISKDIILGNMKRAGYSIRKLAEKTNHSDRTIRTYLNKEEMPENLLREIDNVLRPKKNRINMLFKVAIGIADDEMKQLLNEKEYTDNLIIEICDSDAKYLWDTAGDDNIEFTKASVDIEELAPYEELSKRKENKNV